MSIRRENGRYGKSYPQLTKEFLIEEYSNKRRSALSISHDIGCNVKLIFNYLKSFNIPTNKSIKQNEVKPGDEFNYWTLVKIDGIVRNGYIAWICKCKCGITKRLALSTVIKGKTKSCGCYRKRRRNHKWKGFGEVSGNLICEIRLRAKKKKWEFNLTPEFLHNKLISQNRRCAISNIPISIDKNASVDRINSLKGYTEDNVWWVHKDINKMKMDFDLKQFIEYCQIITKYKEEQNGK